MAVKHIFADGSVHVDIKGHVVRIADAEAVYDLIKTINQCSSRRRGHEKQKEKVSQ